MVNFTETTDKLESEELTSLLNHYLTEMSRIALKFGGTIDKYIGDAIMTFLSDPDSKGAKEDAIACVRMAIAMLQRMRELRSEWQELAEWPFQLRIGINTGYCTVGNFGSADRMDYTIIGNMVNMTARLRSHAEVDSIFLGHETCPLLKDVVAMEEQSLIKVKGFAEPIRCYEVLGLYDGRQVSSGRVDTCTPTRPLPLRHDFISAIVASFRRFEFFPFKKANVCMALRISLTSYPFGSHCSLSTSSQTPK